jgi:RNA polymerase sigma factor (sigma-70 family)
MREHNRENKPGHTPATRASLLIRVKDRSDAGAWSEFHKLYAPLLYRYARGRGLPRHDAEEVRDQCLEVVTRKMPDFEYDKDRGGFKNWLRRVADNKVVDHLRKRRDKIAGTEAMRVIPDAGPTPAETWERSWRNEHLKYCVEMARTRVSERNFRVFEMLLVDNCTVDEVCTSLGLNANQVYKAKARVLKHVSRLMADFEQDPRP